MMHKSSDMHFVCSNYRTSQKTRSFRLRQQNGFTLLEIAIMLVIIGLTIGGVVAGQELLTSARVRTLISQQEDIKIAFLGFRDRFRALPGDYDAASINIFCTPACSNGDGNGLITGITDTPAAPINEYIAVWEHLSNAGFINGNYSYAAINGPTSTPMFMFGQYPTLKYDAVYSGTASARHNLKTGNQIPSHILAEVDRKVDDGYATTGSYRFSAFAPSTSGTGIVVSRDSSTGLGLDPSTPTGPGSCYSATGPSYWSEASSASNCGAASLI